MKLFNVKGKESQKEKEMDTQILRNGWEVPEMVTIWSSLQPDKVIIHIHTQIHTEGKHGR